MKALILILTSVLLIIVYLASAGIMSIGVMVVIGSPQWLLGLIAIVLGLVFNAWSIFAAQAISKQMELPAEGQKL